MARPKQYSDDRVTTAIRLPAELQEAFRRLAEERDVSVNYLINRAMLRYLDEHAAEARA